MYNCQFIREFTLLGAAAVHPSPHCHQQGEQPLEVKKLWKVRGGNIRESRKIIHTSSHVWDLTLVIQSNWNPRYAGHLGRGQMHHACILHAIMQWSTFLLSALACPHTLPSSFSWLLMPLIVCALSPSDRDSSHRSPAPPRDARPGQDMHVDQLEGWEGEDIDKRINILLWNQKWGLRTKCPAKSNRTFPIPVVWSQSDVGLLKFTVRISTVRGSIPRSKIHQNGFYLFLSS